MNQEESQPESIAITGMAGRFPGAQNLAEFWRNLAGGVESVTFFEEGEAQDLFPLDAPLLKGDPHLVRARAILENADHFDASFFNVNPREAEMMDPQHRVFLECAWEAMEDGGCNPQDFAGLIGVFAGSSMNTYLLSNLMQNRDISSLASAFQLMVASEKDYLTTRVSYKLNLRGPSLNVQTACSTSLVAVCVACQSLLSYQCDAALAGGVSITFPRRRVQLHQEGGIIAPDGHCRPFDAAAAGTVSGDGAGVVLLKRLSDAIADGDHIWAVIKGSAMNNDGSRKIGFTAPSVEGQAEVIAMAQACAGVAPETISYVEAHGTGTPLGDPIEMAGLAKAFSAGTAEKGFCAVGSVKSNIGHLDVAAGIAGLIKAVLAIEHKLLPPTLHFKRPNPKIDIANSPFYVNDRSVEWKSEGMPRRAGVSSFGIGGTNAHVVLEEPPPAGISGQSREHQLLVISARTGSGLETATANLARHLQERPELNLAGAAFTLRAGRKAFAHRRMLTCRTTAEAVHILKTRDKGRVHTAGPAAGGASVVFMFPGQGAQEVNMGRGLYESEPDFKEQIDLCCELLKPHLDLDLRSILFPSPDQAEAANRQLTETFIAQPALFVIEYALARLWMKWGIQPRAMIGHSLGEYVAACLAGVFELEEGLALVAARGRLMQKQPPGAMLAIRLPEEEINPLLGRHLSLAAINAPSVCVASGPLEAIEFLEKKLEAVGAGFRRLRTSHAFHSEMMDPVVRAFSARVQKMKLSAPRIPYISNVTGTWITDGEALNPNYWASHVRHTVRFADGVEALAKDGSSILLEVGPGHILGAFAQQKLVSGQYRAVLSSLGRGASEVAEQAQMIEALGRLWLHGVEVDWRGFHAQEHRRRVSLPTYPFERSRWCIDPVKTVPGARSSERNGASHLGAAATPFEGVRAAESGAATPLVQEAPRQGQTLGELKSVLEKLSGVDLSGAQVTATFIELGFDSLFLTQASQAVRKRFGADISVRQLLAEFSTLESLASHLDARQSVSVDGRALLNGTNMKESPTSGIAATRVDAPEEETSSASIALTEAQKEIWLASQMGELVSAAYNESRTLTFTGPFDPGAMQQALAQMVSRHEALRMKFDSDGERAIVSAISHFETPLVELSGLDETSRETRLNQIVEHQVRPSFALLTGPLARACIIRLAPDRHWVVLTVHHIVCDGWSIGVLVQELGRLYQSILRGVPSPLPPAASFVEFARREAELKLTPQFHAAETYWTNRFANQPAPVELPADRPRPVKRTYAGSHLLRPMSAELGAAVKSFSVANDCTTFTTLFGAFAVLLHRLSAQDDLVIGVPAAGQVLSGAERVVGHCANLLPLRSRFDFRQSFSDYLAATRQLILEAFQHFQYPFGNLVRKLNLPLELNRIPLANIMFNLGRFRGGLDYSELETGMFSNRKYFINFDLILDITETDGQFVMECGYSSELFDESTVQRWLDEYENLLKSIAANPAQRLADLSLLSERERHRLLVEWNHDKVEVPKARCVHQLVEERATREPQALAAVYRNKSLTYAALNRWANQLARRLQICGVGPESTVGLCSDRSIESLVATLAILKAGGVCVPLDPSLPAERIAFMVEDSRPSTVLVQSDLVIGADFGFDRAEILSINDEAVGIGPADDVNPDSKVTTNNLAYIIYASGSGGQPKGIAMEHRSLANMVSWQTASAAPGGRTLQFSSLGSGVSFQEIFATLCGGGTLVVMGEELRQDPKGLWRLIAREQIGRLYLPFIALKQMAEVFEPRDAASLAVREIIVAGEQLQISPKVVALLETLKDCSLQNQYGSSESGIATFLTLAGAPGRWPALPPIGRPISNVIVQLLDHERHPVPVGVTGEIYLGGECLARGYLRRPALNAERFFSDPSRADGASRLYRTGDLGRWLPDGNIQFMGRQDQRVKIRGRRVEPAEIEAALAQHHDVAASAVIVREEESGENRLVACIALDPVSKLTAGDLREFLKKKLPDYMVPASFVFMNELPVTATGKIDRRALIAAEKARQFSADPVSTPRTPTEEVLAEIWRGVLGLKQVGIHDNFFDLGGHSLLVMQVLSRVREAFEIELHTRQFFETPTVAELAAVVEEILVEEIRA